MRTTFFFRGITRGARIFAATLAFAGCSDGGDLQQPGAPARRPQSTEIALDQTNLAARRIALDHWYRAWSSGAAPEWSTANFAPVVTPLYRPDLEDAAYLEFTLLDGSAAPAGFIVVSTGPHDFPVAHWNSHGLSPTQRLRNAAGSAGGNVDARFYKLDARQYAAEDMSGGFLAALRGSDGAAVTDESAVLDGLTWSGPADTLDRAAYHATGSDTSEGASVVIGPSSLPYAAMTFDHWSSVKSGYASAFGPVRASVAQQAAPLWSARARAQQATGIIGGQSLVIPLLHPNATLTLTGSPLIAVSTFTLPNGAGAARVSAEPRSSGEVAHAQLDISYPTGSTEMRPFGGLSDDDMSDDPPGGGGSGGGDGKWAGRLCAVPGVVPSYDQMEHDNPQNQTSCWSGCGATAWAMLVAWVSHEALDGMDPRWALPINIYHLSGGGWSDPFGPMPLEDYGPTGGPHRDWGVDRVTWEIHEDIHTGCAFPFTRNGFTLPSTMDGVKDYLHSHTWFADVDTHTHGGAHTAGLREDAVNVLCNEKTPAIIGIGNLSHYPMALSYLETMSLVERDGHWQSEVIGRDFYCDMGGGDNGWQEASVYFAGTFEPVAVMGGGGGPPPPQGPCAAKPPAERLCCNKPFMCE